VYLSGDLVLADRVRERPQAQVNRQKSADHDRQVVLVERLSGGGGVRVLPQELSGTDEGLEGGPPHPAPQARRKVLEVMGQQLRVPVKLPSEEVERLAGRQIGALQDAVARRAHRVRVDREARPVTHQCSPLRS